MTAHRTNGAHKPFTPEPVLLRAADTGPAPGAAPGILPLL
jgi:hypothetical protein